MKNYKMVISYDGNRYYGWEHQPNKDTIQGKIESVLSKMCNTSIEVIGAGRTDAGVSALKMVANAFMETELSEKEIKDYLNTYLPDDIAVLDVNIASDRFHARYKAVGKTYRYTCYIGNSKPIFDRKYVTILTKIVDINKMIQASSYLIGEHDFKSFCGNTKMKKSTIRIVDKIEIKQKGDYLYFYFHGTGFLQNMIRILVGTLLNVGTGEIKISDVEKILLACNRELAGPTAPANGLCLMSVDY